MKEALKTLAFLVLIGAFEMRAQVGTAPGSDVSLGGLTMSQQAPNTLVLGSGTGVSYDSNALSSRPLTPNVQYSVYPQIGLNLARPRWDSSITLVPGFSYSSANLPQYQAVSLTSAFRLQYRPTPKLTWNFLNRLVSSTNPFDSLTLGNQSPSVGAPSSGSAALNDLPKTNETASADAAYSLSARTSLTALTSYSHVSYPHDPNLPNAVQPFQQSQSGELSLGWHRSSSPRYQGGLLYFAEFFDAGQGRIKTVGQTIEYALQYSPKPSLHISAMIGPEYIQNTYAGSLGSSGAAKVVNQHGSEWSWTGSARVAWTRGANELLANASKQLGLGTQYQGNVNETTLRADFHRKLPNRADLTLFGGYNINTPVFLGQAIPRLSNNYLSTGAALSKTINRSWVISAAYWYLLQNSPEGVGSLYSGNHNRFALSLSYSIAKPLTK
jgi:hypothetical protein